ncbi:MAG: 4-hydroxy-tetrahydrodipicolinate reductase [Verrucomicrobiales bacterium]
MSLLRIMLTGAKGRMGEAIQQNATDCGVHIVAALDADDPLVLPDASAESVSALIDFSHATASAEVAKFCVQNRLPLVMGTTGQADEVREAILQAAEKIPVVFAPNFSVGVNTLFWLTAQATKILGPDFDLEVVEMHHRHKHDAPSGTARRLAEILAEARDLSYEQNVQHGRYGMLGPRTTQEIGMHALRGGDVVGDHTVVYAADGERVEISHKASSRSTFARGALRAAVWVQNQPIGLYDMQDVLGLKSLG